MTCATSRDPLIIRPYCLLSLLLSRRLLIDVSVKSLVPVFINLRLTSVTDILTFLRRGRPQPPTHLLGVIPSTTPIYPLTLWEVIPTPFLPSLLSSTTDKRSEILVPFLQT